MTQYLFRGKVIGSDQWVYGSLLNRVDSLGPLSLIEVQDKEPPFEIKTFHVYPESVGMWTGWKDKNGKEIYQGDTLRGNMGEQHRDNGSPIVSTIVLRNGGFNVFSKPMSWGYGGDKLNMFCWCDHGSHGKTDVYWQIDEIEVIGNIHEVNPASGNTGINNMFDPNTPQATNEEVKAEGQEIAAVEQEAQEKALDSAEEGSTEG